jgi:hypothetical protein
VGGRLFSPLRRDLLSWETTEPPLHIHAQQTFNVPRGTRPITGADRRSLVREISEESEAQLPPGDGVGQANITHACGMIGSVTYEGYVPSW